MYYREEDAICIRLENIKNQNQRCPVYNCFTSVVFLTASIETRLSLVTGSSVLSWSF